VAGTVTIGKRTWLGAGATVSNNIEITSDCTIGAGAVVIKDINRKGTYVGVPARMNQ
jgi:acetyltransferase-like isoleucine patch superfamily enzyme